MSDVTAEAIEAAVDALVARYESISYAIQRERLRQDVTVALAAAAPLIAAQADRDERQRIIDRGNEYLTVMSLGPARNPEAEAVSAIVMAALRDMLAHLLRGAETAQSHAQPSATPEPTETPDRRAQGRMSDPGRA